MYKDLFSLIAAALNKNKIPILSDEPQWEQIIKAAKKHNTLAALYIGVTKLPKNKLPDKSVIEFLTNNYYNEIRRNILQMHELSRIQNAFEKEGICNLAVKGCKTKQRYPDEVLRSMGDIDMLVKPEQNKLVYTVMQGLGFNSFEEGRKHDHYYNDSKLGVEIHRDIVPSESEFYDYYRSVWKKSKLISDCSCSYEMSIEDEYIFNLVHLIQHFKLGGVGIRFIMDVYLYNHMCELDMAYVDSELKKLGIKQFTDNIVNLADRWFGGKRSDAKHTMLLKRLGKFILSGGIFGKSENANNLRTSCGKNRFLVQSLFPSYRSMKSLYPWLKGKPILLPFAWVLRGSKSLVYRRNNIKSVFRAYQNSDNRKVEELRRFYKDCGLEL